MATPRKQYLQPFGRDTEEPPFALDFERPRDFNRSKPMLLVKLAIASLHPGRPRFHPGLIHADVVDVHAYGWAEPMRV